MKTKIHYYTGNWQQALRPTPPRVGSHVGIADNPDAREWDDFRTCLRKHGLRIGSEPLKRSARLKLDVYRIERGVENSDE